MTTVAYTRIVRHSAREKTVWQQKPGELLTSAAFFYLWRERKLFYGSLQELQTSVSRTRLSKYMLEFDTSNFLPSASLLFDQLVSTAVANDSARSVVKH